ncbi:hypothetical protein GCM10010844_21290 [Deinococcus radiotolerans]|uniref:Uncharacterized protein n=1 Tax=Deinococcus radiotolerans TaxID=1309407 RepID=A0ABQ2FKW3_9DEIO|nr:hypothetical protein GCM10010844_21290 [Deinococcus radiotolerans]
MKVRVPDNPGFRSFTFAATAPSSDPLPWGLTVANVELEPGVRHRFSGPLLMCSSAAWARWHGGSSEWVGK